MRAYSYKFTNPYSGKTFTIGINTSGQIVHQVGRGMLLQDYPEFSLAVRNSSLNKSGQHGIWDFFSFYGERRITFSGIILASSHVDLVNQQNLVKEVLSLPAQPINGVNDGYVQLTWTDATGIQWAVDVKITQDIRFVRPSGNPTRSDFFIALKTSSPYILSLEEYQAEYYQGWKQPGIPLPVDLPTTIPLNYFDTLNLYQSGSGDSPAKYTLYGPAINPKISKLAETFTDDVLISDFTEAWSGGEEDTEHILLSGVGRKLTSTTGSQDTANLVKNVDLSLGRFVTCYIYSETPENLSYGLPDESECYIKFIENSGIDEWSVSLRDGNNTLKAGWNYLSFEKRKFTKIGNPNWANITEIELSIKGKASESLEVTFDDLRSRDITYTESYLKLNDTLLEGEAVEFDTLNGTVLKNGIDVSVKLDPDSQWFFLSAQQNILLYESDDVSPINTNVLPRVLDTGIFIQNLGGYYHFDDGSDSVATDYTVYNNNGVITKALPREGISSLGLKFNGDDSNILVTANAAIQNTFDGGGTIFGGLHAESDGGNNVGRVYSKGAWELWVEDESSGDVRLRFKHEFDGTDGEWRTDRNIPLDENIKFCLKYDNSSDSNDPVLFIGNEEVTLTEVSTPSGTRVSDLSSNFYIGNDSGLTNGFDGVLDEVRIYTAELDDVDIVDLIGIVDIGKYITQIVVNWQDATL